MVREVTATYGSPKGRAYRLLPNDPEADVTFMEVWSGWGVYDCTGRWVLKGIALEWSDQSKKKVYHEPEMAEHGAHEYHTFTFPRHGNADWGLRSGLRIDELNFKTNKGVPWHSGGDGGRPSDHIAKGSLVGFHGTAEGDINSLSMEYRTC